MNHDHEFKARAHRAKGRGAEIRDRFYRDERLEKDGRTRIIAGRIRDGNGVFEDDLRDRNDAEDDIRGYCALNDELETHHDK